jgi:hypothetical protein
MSQSVFEDFMSILIQLHVALKDESESKPSLAASNHADCRFTAEGDLDNHSMFGELEIW